MDLALRQRHGRLAGRRRREEYPCLQHDLRCSEQHEGDETVYVVAGREGGRFFRLRHVEWFVARQLDGRTPLEEIRTRTERQFGKALPAAALNAFLEHARAIGLLEPAPRPPEPLAHGKRPRHSSHSHHVASRPVSAPLGGGEIPGEIPPGPLEAAPATPPRAEPGRLRGDPLYLRFQAFNPERQIAWLLPRLRFCFTPGFVATVIALALAATVVTIGNWTQLSAEFAELYQWQAVVYGWLVLLVTVSAHEFAHGLACTHFGGRVREMGVMLIYFQPAVYCNVSEAWLIPDKARRIWVGAAGPFFDVLQWALAVLVWRITDGGTTPHFVALIVAVTTVARTLLNINPLIKLDAYYVLADAVEIPNLRARAFAYLRYLWTGAGSPEATPRERRVFVGYGLLAGIYSLLLLGYVASWIGGYLVDRYRGLGLLIFMGLTGLAFQRPLAARGHALAARLAQGRPAFAALRPQLAVLLPAALAIVALLPVPFTAGGNFTALPGQNADVRTEVAGTIRQVFIREGERLAAGAPIAQLANDDRLAELNQVKSAIREKQAKLKMLNLGTRAEEIAIARQKLATAATREQETQLRYAEERRLHAARLAAAEAGVTKALEQARYAEDKYALMEPLASVLSPLELREAKADAAIRRKAFDESQAGLQFVRSQRQQALREAMAITAAQRQEAQGELERLLAGARPEEIEAVEAEIASLTIRAADLRDRIERATIRTPHAGIVTTSRPQEMVGQHLEPGGLVATVHDQRQISAEIAVSERDIAEVRVGQPVRLRVRAYPGETFSGEVVGIAPATAAPEHPGTPRIVRVLSEIANPDGRILSDMSGYAKIDTGQRPLFEALGHDLLGSLSVEFWSWW